MTTYLVRAKHLLDVLTSVIPLADGAKYCAASQLGKIEIELSRHWIMATATDRYVGGTARSETGYPDQATDETTRFMIDVADAKRLLPIIRAAKSNAIGVEIEPDVYAEFGHSGGSKLICPLYVPVGNEVFAHAMFRGILSRHLGDHVSVETSLTVNIAFLGRFTAAEKAYRTLAIRAQATGPWVLTSRRDAGQGFVGMIMPIVDPSDPVTAEVDSEVRAFWTGVLS